MQTNLFEELCKSQNVSENAPTTIGYDTPAAVLFGHTAHQAHTCAISRRCAHRRRKEVGMRSPAPLRDLSERFDTLVGLTINLNIILCDVRWSLTALWVPINDPIIYLQKHPTN